MRWHLFANGGFNILYQGSIVESWCCYKGVPHWWNHAKGSQGAFDKFRGEYFLIARPISDMTDEEWESMKYAGWYSTNRQELIDTLIHRDWWQWPQGVVNDMVHVGIYPGPQSHFDDGTVIDGSKLEEA